MQRGGGDEEEKPEIHPLNKKSRWWTKICLDDKAIHIFIYFFTNVVSQAKLEVRLLFEKSMEFELMTTVAKRGRH